jgi:hypothetical protein
MVDAGFVSVQMDVSHSNGCLDVVTTLFITQF